MLVLGFSRIIHAIVAVILGVLCSGIAVTAIARPVDPISDEELNSRLQHLQHLPWAGKAIERQDGWVSGCRKATVALTVGDPLSVETRAFEFVLIRPDTSTPVPAVIVLPTMDGVTAVENTIASKLCAMNVAAIIADVNRNTMPEVIPSWGFEDFNNRLSILTLRTVIDYIERTPYFHPRKIGMIGSSLGGVTTSYMAGIEPQRLGAYVIVVGGGNLPYTLTISDNEKLTELRKLRMTAEGYNNPDQYENKLRESIFLDPMHFSRRAVREKLFMALSKSDTKVPTIVQQDLFAAFNRPEHTVFSVGHVSTVIGMAYFYFNYVSDFLAKRFNIPKLRQTPVNAAAALRAGVLPPIYYRQ